MRKQRLINQSSNEKNNSHIKSAVHNFSSYQLSDDQLTALSYGLDHHIPNKLNCNKIHTEFEQFYQNLVKYISNILDDNLNCFKKQLTSTCERYSKIHLPYKYITIYDSLSRNQSICIMKKDKGRGAAVMGRSKYTEKCINILQTAQFTKPREKSRKKQDTMVIKEIENNINNTRVLQVISHMFKPM